MYQTIRQMYQKKENQNVKEEVSGVSIRPFEKNLRICLGVFLSACISGY